MKTPPCVRQKNTSAEIKKQVLSSRNSGTHRQKQIWGGEGEGEEWPRSEGLGPPENRLFLKSQKQCQNAEHPGACEEEELTQPRVHLYVSQGQCTMALNPFETKAANLSGKAGPGAERKQGQLPALPAPRLVPLDSNLTSPHRIRLLGALNQVMQVKQLGQCLPQEKLPKQGSHGSLSSGLRDLQPKDPP